MEDRIRQIEELRRQKQGSQLSAEDAVKKVAELQQVKINERTLANMGYTYGEISSSYTKALNDWKSGKINTQGYLDLLSETRTKAQEFYRSLDKAYGMAEDKDTVKEIQKSLSEEIASIVESEKLVNLRGADNTLTYDTYDALNAALDAAKYFTDSTGRKWEREYLDNLDRNKVITSSEDVLTAQSWTQRKQPMTYEEYLSARTADVGRYAQYPTYADYVMDFEKQEDARLASAEKLANAMMAQGNQNTEGLARVLLEYDALNTYAEKIRKAQDDYEQWAKGKDVAALIEKGQAMANPDEEYVKQVLDKVVAGDWDAMAEFFGQITEAGGKQSVEDVYAGKWLEGVKTMGDLSDEQKLYLLPQNLKKIAYAYIGAGDDEALQALFDANESYFESARLEMLNAWQNDDWINTPTAIAAATLESIVVPFINFGADIADLAGADVTFVDQDYNNALSAMMSDAPLAMKVISSTATSIGNMAPALVVGHFTAPIGFYLMFGAGTAANSYAEGRQAGYTKAESLAFATLTTAAELSLQKIASKTFGGITSVTGIDKRTNWRFLDNITKSAQGKMGLIKIGGAIAKFAKNVAMPMIGEGLEEYAQEILTPVIRNICFDENNEVKFFTEEALIAGFAGAFSAGLFGTFSGRFAADMRADDLGAAILKYGEYDRLISTAMEDPNSPAYKMAMNMGENPTAHDVGQLALSIGFQQSADALITQMFDEIGYKTEFVDTLTNEGDTKLTNASVNDKTKTVKIARDADPNILIEELARHEYVHTLQETQAYAQFQSLVLNSQTFLDDYNKNGNNFTLEQIIQAARKQFSKNNTLLSEDQAKKELVAVFSQKHMFTDKGLIAEFARIAPRPFEAVRRSIEKIVSVARHNEVGVFYKNAEALYRQMQKEAMRNAQKDSVRDTTTSTQTNDSLYDEGTNSADPNNDTADAIDVEETQNSVSSFFDAMDMFVSRGANGLVFDEINSAEDITEERVRNSRLGKLVEMAREDKRISDEEANKQIGFLVEVARMIYNTPYKEMIYQFIGSTAFSAITSNADSQYKTTIDFGTICIKTQQLINAMSNRMIEKAKEGGVGSLTKSEILSLYMEVGKAGFLTPCPQCFVFQRWVGLGSRLDEIGRFQNLYANMPYEDALIIVKKMDALIDMKATQDNISRPDARQKLIKSDVSEEIRAWLEAYGYLTSVKVKRSVSQKDGLTYSAFPKESPVPIDVLYNLNAGDEFATKYPRAWAYRTSGGAAMGKAIQPYTDARLGEIIAGIANIKALKNRIDDLVGQGRMKEAMAAKRQFNSALKKVKSQNLIGGQRLNSTSDFRYDHALDYMLVYFELQALGSNVQMYTKVADSVPLLATTGSDINVSIMPQGKGFDVIDGKQVLTLSDKQGVDYSVALSLTEQYDNVQMVMVGINDDAINLALEGNEITFVIPYHASGGEAEFVTAMIKSIGEKLDRDYVYDYTLVQSDHIDPNSTDEQIRLRKIRKALLMRNVEIKDNDGKVIVKGKKDSLKITEDDLALIQGNKFLPKMLERMYGINYNLESVAQEERYKGVSFDSKTAEQIFPWEYWDTSTTIDTAYINGDLFQEYCESLGIIPRFSGMTSKGDKMSYGDFTKSKGYWKLLIDRRMYDRAGKYRDQQAVTATFNAEFFDQQVQAGRFAARNAIVDDNILDETVADIVTNSNQIMANFSEQFYNDNAAKYKALLSLHTNPQPIQNSIGTIDDIINQLIEDYGEVERGAVVSENQRNVPLPKSVDGQTVTSKWNRTALEANAVDDETVAARREEIIRDATGYVKVSNRATVEAAQKQLDDMGFDRAVSRIFSIYQNNFMPSAQDLALAELLIVEAGKRGEHIVASALIRDTAFIGTKLGQAVQALSIIKKLPMEYQVELMQKTAKALTDDIPKNVRQKISRKNEAEIESVKQQISDLEAQLDELMGDNTTAEISRLTKQINKLLKQIEDAKANNNAKAEELAELRKEIKELQKARNSLRGQTKSLDEKIKTASETNGKTTADLLAKLAKLQTKLRRLNGEIVLSPETEARILSAQTEEEQENAVNDAVKELARQIPSTFKDKFNAFRYMSMLSNLTTHARNTLGNAVMLMVTNVKMVFEQVMQLGMKQKTVSVAGAFSPRYLRAANQIRKSKTVQNMLKGSRYMEAEVFKDRVIFNVNAKNAAMRTLNKGLEGWRKGVSNALEVEDAWFKTIYFDQYLASWMKANGINPDNVTQSDIPNEVIENAIREAKRGTYQEESKFAKTLNQLEKNGLAWEIAIGGIIPFKRTPINILKQGVRYSPFGLGKGLVDLARNRKNMSANEIVNELAMGATGTSLFLIGMWMFSCGALSLELGDEPEDRFDALTGGQGFSLVIGGKHFSIDWLSPSAMPLFVGAATWDLFEEDGMSFSDILEASLGIFNPVFEMSMLQGIQDIIESARYGESPIPSVLSEILTGYFTQAVPQPFRKINQIFDPVKRDIYGDPTNQIPDGIEAFVNNFIAGYLPFASTWYAPLVDAWGRERENAEWWELLISPAYYSEKEQSPMEQELARLYKSTGESIVFPKVTTKVTYENNEYKLSPEEQAQFNKTKGQFSYDILTDITESEEYKALPDKIKADVVGDMFDAAEAMAEAEYFAGKNIEYDKPNILLAYEAGIDPIAFYFISKVSGYDNTRKAMQQYDMSADEKTAIWEIIYPYATEYWNGRKIPVNQRKKRQPKESNFDWNDFIVGG